MKKYLYILIFCAVCCISVVAIYKNYQNSQNDLHENYVQAKAVITSVGCTGQGIKTKAMLGVNYYYDNEKHSGFVTRACKKDGFYSKGDTVTIHINKNSTGEIK
jgi:non-ribosomal peptide synthetase component E (peptide arylation enzyme)